jgi:hypothetical protein
MYIYVYVYTTVLCLNLGGGIDIIITMIIKSPHRVYSMNAICCDITCGVVWGELQFISGRLGGVLCLNAHEITVGGAMCRVWWGLLRPIGSRPDVFRRRREVKQCVQAATPHQCRCLQVFLLLAVHNTCYATCIPVLLSAFEC